MALRIYFSDNGVLIRSADPKQPLQMVAFLRLFLPASASLGRVVHSHAQRFSTWATSLVTRRFN
jgi:hypothetical protein